MGAQRIFQHRVDGAREVPVRRRSRLRWSRDQLSPPRRLGFTGAAPGPVHGQRPVPGRAWPCAAGCTPTTSAIFDRPAAIAPARSLTSRQPISPPRAVCTSSAPASHQALRQQSRARSAARQPSGSTSPACRDRPAHAGRPGVLRRLLGDAASNGLERSERLAARSSSRWSPLAHADENGLAVVVRPRFGPCCDSPAAAVLAAREETRSLRDRMSSIPSGTAGQSPGQPRRCALDSRTSANSPGGHREESGTPDEGKTRGVKRTCHCEARIGLEKPPHVHRTGPGSSSLASRTALLMKKPAPSLRGRISPSRTFELDNGLTRHRPRRSRNRPIVAAVHVWYHVGSKNERARKTGFAHLFEHLMFNGSENLDARLVRGHGRSRRHRHERHHELGPHQLLPDRSQPRPWIGLSGWRATAWATSWESSTRRNSTNNARRGQERKAPARKRSLRPGLELALRRAAFPSRPPLFLAGHREVSKISTRPRWKTSRTWFRQYYGPSNAVLVLAGDIDVEDRAGQKAKILRRHSGRPPAARATRRWVADRAQESRRQIRTGPRSPDPASTELWNTPEQGTAAGDRLQIAAQILAGDKNSRLYKRLVHDDELATGYGRLFLGRELAGWFLVQRRRSRPGSCP